MNARRFILMLLCAALAFSGAFASSYAGEPGCVTSQTEGDGAGAAAAQDCENCDPQAGFADECCAVAGGAAAFTGAGPSVAATAFQQALGGALPGYRSLASRPDFQPPR